MLTIAKIKALVGIKTKSYETPVISLVGLDTADAYTANDALGPQFWVPLPFPSGVLQAATLYDRDDEGTQIDLVLSREQWVTQIADDAAMAPADAELTKILYTVEFDIFKDYINGQISWKNGIARPMSFTKYNGGYGLWVQAVTQSTPTIAAGSFPAFTLTFMPDE